MNLKMSSNDEFEEHETAIELDIDEINNYLTDVDTTCTICQAEFLDLSDLKIHLDQVHKKTSFVLKKCHFCQEHYSDLMGYAVHLRDYHLTFLKSCNLCWRIFDDFDQHRKHCRKHNVSKQRSTYNCSQCPQRYDDVFTLTQHEYKHNNATEGVMLHDVLPYLAVVLNIKAASLLKGLNTASNELCVACGISMADLDAIISHSRSQKCSVYGCEKCGNVYKKKKNIVKHLQSSCNLLGFKEKKTRLCPDCNTHINTHSYNKHKRLCKPIKCYSCDIIFSSMNDWSNHQSQEHAGMSVEVETCSFCWKRCVGRVAMQKHIDKIHRPEFHMYKYFCIYCKTAFKHPQKLFAHFVTRHKDIYPYNCKICDKTFRYRKKFTIHIKMVHKSVGFVEFDENYHVFFTETKSKDPFIPKSIYGDKVHDDGLALEKDTSNVELNSDFLNATETEGNQTEVEKEKLKQVESKGKAKLKRKRNSNKDNTHATITLESSDEDEPLLVVRKRIRLQKKKTGNVVINKYKSSQKNRTLLTCNICKKYCYTVQNYNHHISLHSKHEVKKCIKCSKIFKSKNKLNEHIAKEHSSSKLTDTLKSLLEKRKTGGQLSDDLPASIKFRRTIKKCTTEIDTQSANITAVNHKLSVQKFLENFVPEENKVELPKETSASLKLVKGQATESRIKMTKFKPHPISTSLRLAMPVKFVDNPEKVKVTIKLVKSAPEVEENNVYYSDHYDDTPDMDNSEVIPEVAEEVLLEGTEEPPKFTQTELAHKIVIPKFPTQMTNIRIAHLFPQAPFYKIVKVKDVLEQNSNEEVDKNVQSSIKLPDGTKLVTANPLKHLLGSQEDKFLKAVTNKYYKPRIQNFQGMLAKALSKLETPTYSRKRKQNEVKGDK